ncbi:hypothetical protein [Mesobacterium pallidum]|uniref:hypothetical protein n=1 Tax=Mesobacterium pallidum TaxID=2872037 RepID=UPI001EE23A6C
MSNPDSFIEEVTEEVRRDRLYGLLRRYGWIGIVAVLAIVGGAAWNEWRTAQATARAEALGDAILAATDRDDPAARAEALAAVEGEGAARDTVVPLLIAGEQIAAGAPEDGAAALDALATNGDVPAIYRNIAAFKGLLAASGTASIDERRAGFEALAAPGSALRLLAEEQLALLEVEAGNTEGALERLNAIIVDSEATAGLRQRGTSLIVALGGEPEALPGN